MPTVVPRSRLRSRDHVEHLELVGDVEEGGGFVQQQHLGLLGERHRDPYPLSLPAGELLEQTLLQRVGAGGRERLGHGLLVLRAPLRDQPLMGEAAPGDQFAHGHPVGGERGLREQSEAPGELLPAQGAEIAAIQHDTAAASG